MTAKSVLVGIAEIIALIILAPFILWQMIPLPEYSRFTAPSQLLSYIPGLTGILLRRIWYRRTLRRCGRKLTVDWLGVIRTSDTEIGERCTFGVANWIGWACVGDDVITGSHVVMLSGRRQHAMDDLTRPMRDQPGTKRQIRVGNNVWIGASAIVMEDVADGTVIGAGSVVTRTHPVNAVIVGNPARVIRIRSSKECKQP